MGTPLPPSDQLPPDQPGTPVVPVSPAAGDAAEPATREITWADVVAFARKLGPVAVLAGIALTLPALGLLFLGYNGAAIGEWLRARPGEAALIYVAGAAVLSGLGLLPTHAQALLAGWVFGFALGGPLALLAFCGGSAVGYVVARLVTGERVRLLIDRHPQARAIDRALLGGSALWTAAIVTAIRLPPNSPFAMTNLVLAAAKVRFPLYVIGTLLGMAPRTLIVCGFGSSLSELDFSAREGWLSFAIGLVVTMGVLVVLYYLSQRALERLQKHSATG